MLKNYSKYIWLLLGLSFITIPSLLLWFYLSSKLSQRVMIDAEIEPHGYWGSNVLEKNVNIYTPGKIQDFNYWSQSISNPVVGVTSSGLLIKGLSEFSFKGEYFLLCRVECDAPRFSAFSTPYFKIKDTLYFSGVTTDYKVICPSEADLFFLRQAFWIHEAKIDTLEYTRTPNEGEILTYKLKSFKCDTLIFKDAELGVHGYDLVGLKYVCSFDTTAHGDINELYNIIQLGIAKYSKIHGRLGAETLSVLIRDPALVVKSDTLKADGLFLLKAVLKFEGVSYPRGAIQTGPYSLERTNYLKERWFSPVPFVLRDIPLQKQSSFPKEEVYIADLSSKRFIYGGFRFRAISNQYWHLAGLKGTLKIGKRQVCPFGPEDVISLYLPNTYFQFEPDERKLCIDCYSSSVLLNSDELIPTRFETIPSNVITYLGAIIGLIGVVIGVLLGKIITKH